MHQSIKKAMVQVRCRFSAHFSRGEYKDLPNIRIKLIVIFGEKRNFQFLQSYFVILKLRSTKITSMYYIHIYIIHILSITIPNYKKIHKKVVNFVK